tara:strand:+ start:967 stop:1107 length:141 start_codon:yes stop_codon:yes gene_type:complete
MTINFLDVIKRIQNNRKGEKCFKTAFNMAMKHIYPPEVKVVEEAKV